MVRLCASRSLPRQAEQGVERRKRRGLGWSRFYRITGERRMEVLSGVLRGELLIFGGTKALTIAEDFHAAVMASEKSVAG